MASADTSMPLCLVQAADWHHETLQVHRDLRTVLEVHDGRAGGGQEDGDLEQGVLRDAEANSVTPCRAAHFTRCMKAYLNNQLALHIRS